MFATDRTMPVWELAMEAEARGLDSVYLPEHTHIPVSRRTPPPTGDAELPEEYRRTVDPLVALAVAAARTEKITLGTGILLAAQREPIVTAKAIATLDAESGGRFVLGIGFGWNEDEIEHHHVDFKRRRDVCRDHVLAMRSLWQDDIAEYHGEFFELAPSWSWPKPTRPGGPPVLIGGAAGPKLFAAIAEYADGWIPIGGAGVRAALDDLRRARATSVDATSRSSRSCRSGRCPSPASSTTTSRSASPRWWPGCAGAGATRCSPFSTSTAPCSTKSPEVLRDSGLDVLDDRRVRAGDGDERRRAPERGADDHAVADRGAVPPRREDAPHHAQQRAQRDQP